MFTRGPPPLLLPHPFCPPCIPLPHELWGERPFKDCEQSRTHGCFGHHLRCSGSSGVSLHAKRSANGKRQGRTRNACLFDLIYQSHAHLVVTPLAGPRGNVLGSFWAGIKTPLPSSSLRPIPSAWRLPPTLCTGLLHRSSGSSCAHVR